MYLVLFATEVYAWYHTEPALWSYRAGFSRQSASSFPGMAVCPGTQCILVSILALRRVLTLGLIYLARGCLSPGFMCSVHWMAAGELLKTSSIVAPGVCRVSVVIIDWRRASPIAHSFISLTYCRSVPRWLQKACQLPLSYHTAVAPTLSSSDYNPSIWHIQTHAPTLPSLSLFQYIASLFPQCRLSIWRHWPPARDQSWARPCSLPLGPVSALFWWLCILLC